MTIICTKCGYPRPPEYKGGDTNCPICGAQYDQPVLPRKTIAVEPSRSPDSSYMRGIGISLTVLGIIWGIVALNMNTTITTDEETVRIGSYSKTIPSRTINNIGLMDRRREHLMIAGGCVIVGVLLFGFSTIQSQGQVSRGNDLRKCPSCAELIKREAIMCRYCGNEVVAFGTSAIEGSHASYQDPVSKAARFNWAGLVTKKRLIVAIGLLIGFPLLALYVPTTVALDHLICSTKVNKLGDFYVSASASTDERIGSRQGLMKTCMGVKGHMIKAEALSNLPLRKELADAKNLLAKATDTYSQDMLKKIVVIYEEAIAVERSGIVFNVTNWQ